MTGLRRYIVDDYAENFRHGRLGRREFLRRLAACAGGAALGVAGLESKASSALPISTKIDSNNNLVVNGQPFMIIHSFLDYKGLSAQGYTLTQADAKLAQCKAAGCNIGSPPGGLLPYDGNQSYYGLSLPQYQVQASKFGWVGAFRTLNYQPGDPTPFNSPAWFTDINTYKNNPLLLGWGAGSEVGISVGDVNANVDKFVSVTQSYRNTDPSHQFVISLKVTEGGLDLGVIDLGQYPWRQSVTTSYWRRMFNASAANTMFVELSIPPPGGLPSLFSYLEGMGRDIIAQPGTRGWFPSISTTVIAELFGKPVQKVPTLVELTRYFMMQVAMNCKAFELYFGSTVRDGNQAVGLLANQGNMTASARISLQSNMVPAGSVSFDLEGIRSSDGVTIRENGIIVSDTTEVLSANTFSTFSWVGTGQDLYDPPFDRTPNTVPSITVRQGLGGPILGKTTAGAAKLGCGLYALGDQGLPVLDSTGARASYLDLWNNAWNTVIPNVKALESVVLAPGDWVQITAITPQFFSGLVPTQNRPDSSRTGFQGIYAAKKTVSGVTYVIAINTNQDAKGNELPVRAAKIDLGRIISRATRLFNHTGAGPSSNPPVSFSGSVITQDFEPMMVHVYKVTEGV